jgi:putative nucleotidyltransferase with HDIG domain
MEPARLVLSATDPSGRLVTWNAVERLRVGRLPGLEVLLDDPSISRLHAEVAATDDGWKVCDLGSSNGTFLNGVRIGRTPARVRQGDTLQLGSVVMRVQIVREYSSAVVRVGNQVLQVEAAAGPEAWDNPPADDNTPDKAFVRLLTAAGRVALAASPNDALQAVVADAVAVFGAQRGGVFLTDRPGGDLIVRAVAAARGVHAPKSLSRTLAAQAVTSHKSLLYADCTGVPELQAAESVTQGSMASVICAVLRSPDEEFGVLHLDRGPLHDPFTRTDLARADALATVLAPAVERARLVARHEELFMQAVTALAEAVEMRDSYTGNHTHRVTTYALMLAEELGMPAADRRRLQQAATLHDIGKIAIDDHILRKPGKLTDDEFEVMKTHVLRGADIVQMVPGLAWALPVVRSHHEKWDGKGYPDGLRGEDTPFPARIVAVADAFDAMTSDRPYRRGMPSEKAFAEIVRGSGTHFDPRCAEAFVRLRSKVEAIMDQANDFRQKAETSTDTISRQELIRQLKIDQLSVPTPTPKPPG